MPDEPRPGKAYKTYAEQVELLSGRGMDVGDPDRAQQTLRRINYYRLSGYWYPFRKKMQDGRGRTDTFLAGTTLDDVVSLYDFDARLRAALFTALSPIELSVRALLGHELGRIDPYAHLNVATLGPVARRKRSAAPSERYIKWREKYGRELNQSHEDFVKHHHAYYSGLLPIWAAVEILDWGQLTHLFAMSPQAAREAVSGSVGLSAPQFESWLKSMNIVRNVSAHHGRLFNRVYDLKPRLPSATDHPELAALAPVMNRAFGQLTIIQYLMHRLGVGNTRLLPAVLGTYPNVKLIPIGHTGAPDDWYEHRWWTPPS